MDYCYDILRVFVPGRSCGARLEDKFVLTFIVVVAKFRPSTDVTTVSQTDLTVFICLLLSRISNSKICSWSMGILAMHASSLCAYKCTLDKFFKIGATPQANKQASANCLPNRSYCVHLVVT